MSPSLPHPLKSRMFHSANHRQNPIWTIVIAAFHSTIFKTNFTATSMRPTQPCSQCYLSPEGLREQPLTFPMALSVTSLWNLSLRAPWFKGFRITLYVRNLLIESKTRFLEILLNESLKQENVVTGLRYDAVARQSTSIQFQSWVKIRPFYS